MQRYAYMSVFPSSDKLWIAGFIGNLVIPSYLRPYVARRPWTSFSWNILGCLNILQIDARMPIDYTFNCVRRIGFSEKRWMECCAPIKLHHHGNPLVALSKNIACWLTRPWLSNILHGRFLVYKLVQDQPWGLLIWTTPEAKDMRSEQATHKLTCY